MAHARDGRFQPRMAAALAGVVALTLVLGALTGPAAGAATSTKFYTATVTPTSSIAGGTATYTFTIGNSSTSTQLLGSGNITVAAGFTSVTVGAVTPPPGKVWTATLVAGVITLRNPGPGSTSRLAPGESVSVLVTATAPTACGSFTWTTAAKQSNDFNGTGNDFVRVGADPTIEITGCGLASIVLSPASATIAAGGSQAYTATGYDANGNSLGDVTGDTVFSIGPDGSCTLGTCTATVAGPHTVTGVDGAVSATASLTVVPGPPDHVSFGQGPTDVQEATSITPSVTVIVQDVYGNTVTSSSAAVVMAIGTNPSGGVLSGTSNCPAGPGTVCQSAVGGIATFADLSIDAAGTGYTLAASSSGLTGATSGTFSVFVVLAPCVAGGCVGSTGANADATNTTILQDVTIPSRQVDGTLELGSDPSSEAVASTFCGGQACLTGSFIMQVVPPTNSTYLTDQPISLVLVLDKSIAPGTGVPHFKVFSAGSLSEVGTQLAGCPKKGPITQKCISEQHRDNAGDVVITILIPVINGQAVDPYWGPR
jgi:hypothetical protein